jgi:hypothetical protein
MLMKKLTLAAGALAVSASAFADHYAPHYVVRPAYRHYYHQPHYYQPHYYQTAPRVVVVQRPVPIYPAYPASVDVNTGLAIVAGAVIGRVIAHELVR